MFEYWYKLVETILKACKVLILKLINVSNCILWFDINLIFNNADWLLIDGTNI